MLLPAVKLTTTHDEDKQNTGNKKIIYNMK